jgi:hypothetical protein
VQTGFLLTPVSASPLYASAAPELSTWAMLLVGFAGLGLAGYRRGRPSSPQRSSEGITTRRRHRQAP